METNKILSADLLDIIFDGRNKTYGAYYLRKTYINRLIEALLITTALCVVITVLPHILAMQTKHQNVQMFVKDVSLEDLKEDQKKAEEPPPPPPPKQEIPKVEITKFTPPLIVKDAEVKEDEEVKEVSQLADTKIGSINQEGVKDDGIIAAPLESKGTGFVAPPKHEEDYDKIYTVVEIPAEFPGGQAAWIKYLERNLNRDIPIQNGAPVGKYIVTLSFIVDKNGIISDVKAESDPGYGTKEEAMRVIKKGPDWHPAVQNGRTVNYRHIQNIVFIVAETE